MTTRRPLTEPAWARRIVMGIALAFLGAFLVVPLVAVFVEALRRGVGAYLDSLADGAALHAITLTLVTAAIAVPLNLVFGVAAAWALAKFEFTGRSVLIALIDLPLAVSPVISGLVFVLLFGRQGWLGPWLASHDLQVIFAVPGIVVATTFVTVPFVARQLIPLMQAQGTGAEEAAAVLGAGGWQTFRRVTLPSIRWALAYGVVLALARGIGEYGAVAVVSGRIEGKTETATLRVQDSYENFNLAGAYGISLALAAIAVFVLVAMTVIRPREATA